MFSVSRPRTHALTHPGRCLRALLLLGLALLGHPGRAAPVEVVTLIDYPPVSFATRPGELLEG